MTSKCAATRRALETRDMAFLEDVSATSRAEEMTLSGWLPAQIAVVLSMQLRTQHTYYQEHHRDAEFLIVELDGQRIGRPYQYWGPTTLNIIDFPTRG